MSFGNRRTNRAAERAPNRRHYCQRFHRDVTGQAVSDCPYYAGAKAGLQSDNPRRFCEYQPGRDAVSYGFPQWSARTQWS